MTVTMSLNGTWTRRYNCEPVASNEIPLLYQGSGITHSNYNDRSEHMSMRTSQRIKQRSRANISIFCALNAPKISRSEGSRSLE